MVDTPISSQIFSARDAIRTQIIDLLQEYMELDNIDLTQSSFLSFIIDILSTLSSNLMFYQNNIYREFFLTQAQLPESIYNLSAFLGYQPQSAVYSTSNILMKIPLPFTDPDATFIIPEGFEFTTSDGIKFVTFYETTVELENNTAVHIHASSEGKEYDIPVNVDTTSELQFQFVLPVRQYTQSIQEFQIDENLQPFQFTDINIPVAGKVAELIIYVKDPGSSPSDTGKLYTEYSSVSLMSSDDYGYVVRESNDGKKIYFGNGLMGKQPLPGSTVVAYINETEGNDGNVISGSIRSGETIYCQQSGITTVVNYVAINPSPASGGRDQESLQEIKNNAIASLTTLHRLVSESDYQNANVIISDSPLASNSIPVLKRSDLKCNEIQLYTILKYDNGIVPTRSVFYSVPTGTTVVPRETIITKNGVEYSTLFDMTFDGVNTSALYHYILSELNLVPTLIESWGHPSQDTYHFHANELTITVDSTAHAVFDLSYYSNEVDFDDCECTMKILSTDDEYIMTNNPGAGGGNFTYTFPDYLDIPTGEQTFYFTVSNPNLTFQPLISQYSVEFTFRQDLKSMMMSNTVDDGTTTIIYDIPVVRKSYYDSITKSDFELLVLQKLMSSMELKSYRMLTDFVNVKFCNSTGLMKNMLYNETTRQAVVDIGLTTIPASPNLSDRYIVSGNEGGTWDEHRDEIAVCTDATAVTWIFIQPNSNDMVYVTNKSSNYIFTEYGWRKPVYDIPLKIRVEVFKINDSAITESGLISDIREKLIETFENRFGPNITIHRSEIISAIHEINGVSHCRLITPQSDIFFDFDISTFEQQDLLEYTPEWIFFTEDDITIKIFTVD